MTFHVYKVAGGPLGYLKTDGVTNTWTSFADSDCYASAASAQEEALSAREIEAQAHAFRKGHAERLAYIKAVTFSCSMAPIDTGELDTLEKASRM